MKIFKHKVFFLDWVNTLTNKKFNITDSTRNFPYFLVTGEGETLKAQTSRQMLENINGYCGEVIDVDQSLVIRSRFNIIEAGGSNLHVNKGLVTANEEEKLLKGGNVEVVAKVPVKEDTVVEEPEITEEAVVKEDVAEDSVEVDWEWINSLSNSKDDRQSLDEYAESKFEIKLKRNMKIENMIKVFKEALDNK